MQDLEQIFSLKNFAEYGPDPDLDRELFLARIRIWNR